MKKDYQWHGTSVASKITGRIHGVSRQALIIPVVCEETDASSLAALFAVLRDIPIRRARGEALPGKTVMVITWAIETERLWSSYKYVFERIMQSGIILVASAGNYGALDPAKQKGAGPKLMLPPQMWASDDFPIIRVGGTDLEGNVRPWSQEADVHTVGEPAFGARPGTTGDHDADGTCGGQSNVFNVDYVAPYCYACVSCDHYHKDSFIFAPFKSSTKADDYCQLRPVWPD